jgi:hypothetical protein
MVSSTFHSFADKVVYSSLYGGLLLAAEKQLRTNSQLGPRENRKGVNRFTCWNFFAEQPEFGRFCLGDCAMQKPTVSYSTAHGKIVWGHSDIGGDTIAGVGSADDAIA